MSEADSHVEAWLAHEPGAAIALRFCAPPQRATFALWGVLMHLLEATRFDLVEPVVAQAKLGWWCEELRRAANGTAQHPVLRALLEQEDARRVDARAWAALGDSAWLDPTDGTTPPDITDAIDAHRPHADRIAALESMLFAADTPVDAVAVGLWLRQWRAAWVTRDAQRARWPLQLLARHQLRAGELVAVAPTPAVAALHADLATALEARLVAPAGGSFWRRWRSARDRWQLREWRRGRIAPALPGPFRALGSAWSAARAARNA